MPPPDSSGGGARLPNNRKALFSVVVGVAAFLALVLFPFGAVVLGFCAITSGFQARHEIAQSHGEEGGEGLTVYGVMIGGVGLVFGVIALAFSLGP